MSDLINHELVPNYEFRAIKYETRPVRDRAGRPVEGLHQVWVWLDNPKQFNSYTTEAVKEMILAVRRASADRRAVALVLTAVGDKAFCTGGNTAEYAAYYANRPPEYLQYMRLFNDMVTNVLLCDKPVICRVNGMRIGGGQEVGMACDFSLAGDHARFGQAGPQHGSAPVGGSTDFLHLYVGYAKATESMVLGEHWSAHKALRLGLLNEIVPVHKDAAGRFHANPWVITDRERDEFGRPVFGAWKTGADRDAAKAEAAGYTVDLSRLDDAVDRLVTTLAHTFPDCTRVSLEGLRKKKLEHWLANSESSRSWLGLNMNTEASAGFRAFHYGTKEAREIDFLALRRALAEGARFDADLVRSVMTEDMRRAWAAAEGEG